MKICSLLLSTFLLTLSFSAKATIDIGTGFNSATGGRVVPSLNLGIGWDSFIVVGSSTGVATSVYSHSAYSLGGYWTKKAGDFIWGDITAGFGLGAFYEARTYKPSTSTTEETSNEASFGPAFFSQWKFLGPVFISVEAIAGIGNSGSATGQILGLNYRDHVNFILGVEL